MKPALIVFAAVAVTLAFSNPVLGGSKPKQRDWKTGILLDSQRSQNLVGAVGHPPVGFDKRQRTTNIYETQDTFVIEADTHTYTVTELVRGKPTVLTVNGPVKFAIEDTTLYLMDENGKEHRAVIVKKVLRQPSEPPK